MIDAAAPGRVLPDGLGPLVARLRERGCTVVAPVAKDRVVALGEIESADELATGWVDVQEPGHYRAESTTTGPFRHAAPAAPWKRWLHPEQRLVVRLRSGNARPDLDASGTTVTPLAFVGIQSCDLAAIGRLDVVLANDDEYRARRESLVIVAVACTDPAADCFCVSAGTGPWPGPGADIVLRMLDDDTLLATAVTTSGADLLDEPSLRQGLGNLWAAEAESAGLQLAALHCIGTGVRDSSEGYALAELSSGGEQYVLRATRCIKQYDAIVVHADRPNRWEVL